MKIQTANNPYLKKLTIHSNLHNHGIKVLYDSGNNNFLIVLCPRLEDWIINAGESNLDTRRFGLPNDQPKLHEVIKS